MSENRFCGYLDKIAAWSLYVMIFALPFSKSIIEITIVTALVSVVAKKALAREKLLNKNTVNVFLGIFILASLISVFNSYDIALSIRAFFTKILKFAALFLITGEIIDTRKKLANFVIIAVSSCVLILIDGAIQYFFLHKDILHSYPVFNYAPTVPSFLGAPTASFPFPNDFAAWILIFIFPTGAYLFFGKAAPVKKYMISTLFFALFYFLVLTKVRGAWVSFLGGLGFLAFLKPKVAGGILLIALMFGTVLAHKQLLPYAGSLTTLKDRGSMWVTGWAIFKEHPIIGNGVNTFFNKFKMERQDEDRGKRGSYAHNCYLQMACDIGLFGLFSFIGFAAAVLFRGFRSLKAVREPFLYSLILGLGLGLAAFLLHSAVDTNLYSLPLATLFWLSAGVLLAAVKLTESNE